MSIPVLLPALGESVVEGTLSQWLVKEGDHVERDQPLAEVTTDKVDAEIPAPAAGRIELILVSEGEVVPVGGELARIDEQASVPERSVSEPTRTSEPVAATPHEVPHRSTPVARRAAEARGVDVRDVPSGAGQRVTKRDVLAHMAEIDRPTEIDHQREAPRQTEPSERAPFAVSGLSERDRVVPMTPLRRLVAEHMVYSKRTSPHVGTVAEIDMGNVAALRDREKTAFRASHGFALSFLPFIVHATVRALREHPRLNASVLDDAIVEKADLNVGIAVETEKGLVVPVVRQADRLSLAGLAEAVEDLASRARSKRLSADDLQGGTFTLSNPGRHGNLYGFAIINQPQVAILRMGEIVKRPVVRTVDGQDAIVIRPTMHLALSYDHRAVDGAPANAFLRRVRELLEEATF